jgi:hypothetical protein
MRLNPAMHKSLQNVALCSTRDGKRPSIAAPKAGLLLLTRRHKDLHDIYSVESVHCRVSRNYEKMFTA